MKGSDPKVIFITCWGRSGSTILNNILGEIPGFFGAGELHSVWRAYIEGSVLCGCGHALRRCEVWSHVMRRLEDTFDAGEMDEVHSRLIPLHNTSEIRQPAPGSQLMKDLVTYRTAASALYRTITEITGARVIVDATKQPVDAAVVGTTPGIQSCIVHLVRDPRAVAFSWARRKEAPEVAGTKEMARFSVARSAANWVRWNLAAETARKALPGTKSTLLRYEDLIESPRLSLNRVLELAGEEGKPLPLKDETAVQLTQNHTVEGNPGRFRTGNVMLREDDEWRRSMTLSRRLVATAISLPRLKRYGYDLT